MKFGAVLDRGATQEWKRAYIDYRALKKLIKRIKLRQEAALSGSNNPTAILSSGDDTDLGNDPVDDDSDSSDKEDHGPYAVPLPKQAKKRGSGFWSRKRESPRLLTGQGGNGIGKTEEEEVIRSPLEADDEDDDGGRTPRAGPTANDHSRAEQGYGATGTSPAMTIPQQRKMGMPRLDLPDSQMEPELSSSEEARIQLPGDSTIITPSSSLQDPGPLDLDTPAGPLDPRTRKDSAATNSSGEGHETGNSSDVAPPPTAHLVGRGNSPRFPISASPRFSLPATPRFSERPNPSPGQDTIKSGTAGRSGSAVGWERRRSFMKSPRLGAVVGRLRSGSVGGVDPPSRAGTIATGVSDPTSAVSANAMRYPTSLSELYTSLLPDEAKFFTLLDSELDKVETFYASHLTQALKRAKELEIQLSELAEHRRVFHEAEARYAAGGWGEGMKNMGVAMGAGKGPTISSVVGRTAELGSKLGNEMQRRIPFLPDPEVGNAYASGSGSGAENGGEKGRSKSAPARKSWLGRSHSDQEVMGVTHAIGNGNGEGLQKHARFERQPQFDPEKYQKYKKNLKIALMEYYKELEILKNYRILNLTGFKKALKKFGKTARIRCVDLYMDEKVSKCTFSSAKAVDGLLKKMEDDYTTSFEKGNHKKAVGKLRGQTSSSSYHYSTFLSGIYIGLGFPAFILGLVKSFEPETRLALPQYDGLLQVYATLFLPVLFAMLFELDLCAFVSARINYTFIMEIDARTALDYRVFLEIPALLFFTLCWCFYFTFHQIGDPQISPFAWPIVWIVFMVAFFLNPIPIYYQHARYWFVSVLGRVITPGYSRVEFIAFFVADLINSLVYSVSNLWFIGCTYSKGWPRDQNIFEVCPSGGNWVYGTLSCLPSLLRLIQCLKRYKDSRLNIHLINGGKYCASIMQYALFAVWRAHGSQIHHWSFGIWSTAAVINSVYTSSWDLLVDWGLLRPDAGFLRESLGFPTFRPYYYVAMIINVFIRFIWVWYIPRSDVRVRVRSFFFALLEMLRRWVWAALRVETEQVGNTDQYRVSREVPLPYRLDQRDSDDDEVHRPGSVKSTKMKDKMSLRNAATRMGELRERLTRRPSGVVIGEEFEGPRGPPGTINAGPRGDYDHREYDRRLVSGDPQLVKSPQQIARELDDE